MKAGLPRPTAAGWQQEDRSSGFSRQTRNSELHVRCPKFEGEGVIQIFQKSVEAGFCSQAGIFPCDL